MKILIIGGTFAGVAAAVRLREEGHEVALIEAESYLGGGVVAAGHTWVKNGGRLTQPNGETKMALYGALREAGVEIYLMARLAGILTDGEDPKGAVIATKYGLFARLADIVIDATEEGRAAAMLTGKKPAAKAAEYDFEAENIRVLMSDRFPAPAEWGLLDNAIHAGWSVRMGTATFGFRFPLDGETERTKIEERAHDLMRRCMGFLAEKKAFQDASLMIPASMTRLLELDPVRDEKMPFVEAELPFDFTLGEKRRLERAAEEKALAYAQKETEKGEATLHFIQNGKEIKAFRLAPSKEKGLLSVGFALETAGLPERKTKILVAGAGTGGAMSAWALCGRGADFLLLDLHYFAGGTNTVGRVFGNWHGYTGGMYGKRQEIVTARAKKEKLTPRSSAMLFWEELFGERFLGGYTVCGALRDGRRVTGVLAANEDGMTLFKADYIIDGTADGDAAYFAGLSYHVGGVRDGMVQTSSMSGWEYNGPQIFGEGRYGSDEDAIDPDSYTDLLRGIGLGYLKNSPYEIVEMCMQRESRAFDCRDGLTMAGIARRETHPDDIAVAFCRHDTHGRTSSIMNQLNLFSPLMSETREIDIRIRLPFGMFLPKEVDNLALVGKAMSGEREAVGLCRMNPDISNAGYAVGTAVAEAAKGDILPLASLDLKKTQEILRAADVLPAWADKPADALGVPEALAALSDPDDAGFAAMCMKKEEIAPYLLEALKEEGTRGDNAAMALAWHGFPEAAPRLLSMLEKERENDAVKLEVREEGQIFAVRADGFEKQINPNKVYGYIWLGMDDPDFSYARINRLIVLLGLAGGQGAEKILEIAEKCGTGPLLKGVSPYANHRVDGHRLLWDDRLWSVVTALERLANEKTGAYLEKLMEDPFIEKEPLTGGKWQRTRAPRVTQFSLAVFRAAAHAGSRKGAERLIAFLEDERAVFRKMAGMALNEVFGESFESGEEWEAYLETIEKLPVSPYRGNPFEG